MPLKCRMPPLKFMATQKQPSQETERAADVLRTGIELYMIISKLCYLQAVLQAVKKDFCKICIY